VHDALRSAASRLAATLVLFGILGSIYVFLIRPVQLRWGATDPEIAARMPEDDVVSEPVFDATRAITIRGRPEEIWPWLVQMGYGRAGFYGFDLIENPGSGNGIRSARSIMPALQNPHTGDALPLSIAATLQFGTIEPNRCLVWRSRDTPSSGVFVWQLVPIDGTHTRLISRIRWRYLNDWQGRALLVFTEFADHVAVRAILRGVRDRVEHRDPRSLTSQAVELGAWLLTLLALVASVASVFVLRRWEMAWLPALGAGLLLQYELYASPSAAISAALASLYLAGLASVLRKARTATTLPQPADPR
jgi:hypothetical protein